MTRHLGSLTSWPLLEYTGPVGREIRGRAVYERELFLVNVKHNAVYTAVQNTYNYCIPTLTVPISVSNKN